MTRPRLLAVRDGRRPLWRLEPAHDDFLVIRLEAP